MNKIFQFFRKAITWSAVIALVVPLNFYAPSIALATKGAGGGSGLNNVGKTTYTTLADLTLTSDNAGDIHTVSNIVVQDKGDLAGTTLQFDTSQQVTVLTTGVVAATSPVTPSTSSITIPITIDAGAGDTVTIHNIRVIATTGSTVSGDEHLSAITAGGTVSGDAIHVDLTAPAAPVITAPATGTYSQSTTPTITGTAEVGSTVKIYDGVTLIASTTADGSGNFSVATSVLAEGSHTITATATDAAANISSASTAITYIVDTTAPVLTFSSPIDGTVSASATPVVVFSATDINTPITYTVTVDGVVVPSFVSGSALSALSNGSHTIAVQATDVAGNSTTQTHTITVNTNLSSVSYSQTLAGGTVGGTIDDSLNSQVVLSNINTTGPVTFNIGNYASNPANIGINGLSAFGKYFDITVNNSANITFPVMVKMYYTNADLAAANITEDKLDGIWFYNSVTGQYQRYANSGVDTADTVVDGVSYAGYVWANVDHFTPMVAAYDTTALAQPISSVSATGDSQATLSWQPVSGAKSYIVRWRPQTPVGSVVGYTTAYTSDTSFNITGLNNGWGYEFGVASVDQYNNVSDFNITTATVPPVAAPVVATPIKTVLTAVKTVPQVSTASPTTEPVVRTPSATQPIETPTTPANDNQGKIAGTQTTSQNKSQAAVVIAILLLALAAGVGGYYGYEWYLQSKTAEGPVYTEKKIAESSPSTEKLSLKSKGRPPKSNTRRNGRW